MANPPDKPQNTDSAEAWVPGQLLLNDFEVQKELGKGGMGKVYLVRSRTTGMQFAVKRAKGLSEGERRNFLAELQTWIDLPEHANLVPCRFFRTVGDEVLMFAEYVKGGSLKDWIDSRKLYEGGTEKALERILDTAIQFARGLHCVHELGLVHQDVKPANVMLETHAQVSVQGLKARVTDFGLARARAATGESNVPERGQSILVSSGGYTPAYCSPEQVAGRKLDRRTDVWSWGVSVLEMFQGGVTWQSGRVAAHSLKAFLGSNREEEYIPAMPEDVAELLEGCFREDTAQRWQSLEAVVQNLKSVYRVAVGNEYVRALGEIDYRPVPQVETHDRRAVSGVQWTDPRKWLATALRLEGGHPSDSQLRAVSAARTRKAQAVEDLAIYDNAQRRFERLVASGRSDLGMQLSMVYMDKALVHQTAGDPQGASSMYERAAAIREKLALHGTSESADSLALVYQNHASLLFNLGDTEKSLEMCDRAIEIRERLVLEEQQEQFADGLAVLYMNKGVALAGLDQREYAVSTYDQAIDVLSRLTREQARRDLDKDLARAYQNKAMSLKALMRFVQAFRCYDDAIAIFERLIGDGRSEVRVDLAGVCMNKASLFLDLDHKQENIEISRKAVALLEELVTREGRTELSHLLARAYTKEANALLVADDYEAGIALSDRAVEQWKRVVHHDGRQEFLAEFQQVELCRDANRETLSNRNHASARKVLESPPDAADQTEAVVIETLGEAGKEVIPMQFDALVKRAHELASEGRFGIADQLCRQAYILRPDDTALLALASACALKIGEVERASELLDSLIRLAPHDKDAWWNLSLCLFKQVLRKQQIFALQKVIELDAEDGQAHNLLADALFFEKQPSEAMLVLAKLKDIPGWEIQAVCKWAYILAHEGKGLLGYMLLNKTIEKYERSAALWFMKAHVLRPFAEYRRQARTAAENAAACLADNPRQLQPEGLIPRFQLSAEVFGEFVGQPVNLALS